MTNKYIVSPSERIIAALSYFSAGLLGFIYYVFALLSKKHLSYFLRYNILQSIFISFLFFTLSIVLGFICNILLLIPLLNVLVSWVILFFHRPILGSYSILQCAMIILTIYLVLYALKGKYPRVYWVSKIVESAIR